MHTLRQCRREQDIPTYVCDARCGGGTHGGHTGPQRLGATARRQNRRHAPRLASMEGIGSAERRVKRIRVMDRRRYKRWTGAG